MIPLAQIPPENSASDADNPSTLNFISTPIPSALSGLDTTAADVQRPFNAGVTMSNDRGRHLPFSMDYSTSIDMTPTPRFSALTTARPSRAYSPVTWNQGFRGITRSSLTETFANGLRQVPAVRRQASAQAAIHKIIPSEGLKTGGVEVTILGSGFTQGLVVFFGGNKATTTTFWDDHTLVCLLPPASQPGITPVTLKYVEIQGQQLTPIPNQMFMYLDDDDSQLTKMILGAISPKMTGELLDIRRLAAKIMGVANQD